MYQIKSARIMKLRWQSIESKRKHEAQFPKQSSHLSDSQTGLSSKLAEQPNWMEFCFVIASRFLGYVVRFEDNPAGPVRSRRAHCPVY